MLPLREIFSAPIADLNVQYEYESRGLRPVDNTPEEVQAAVVEMFDRLASAFSPASEADELQRKVRSIFSECRTETGGRVCSDLPRFFLKNHAGLLT